jgi:hypothetical protein
MFLISDFDVNRNCGKIFDTIYELILEGEIVLNQVSNQFNHVKNDSHL